jgi:hypothetical protein
MNLQGTLSASDTNLSASLGNGIVTVNGYTIELSRIDGGHRLSVSRGNDVRSVDIPDGAKGETGRGIAGAFFNADDALTLVFSDGGTFTTPPLRGPRGVNEWSGISGKPAAFPPSPHGHAQSEIGGLSSALENLNARADALEQNALSTGMQAAAYHLGFYLDADGDLCQREED